mgnify:FL=1
MDAQKTTEQIIIDIAKFKTAIEKTANPETRAKFEKKLKELESDLEEAQKKVEKKEEETAAEEKKDLKKTEEDIKKFEAAIAKTANPETRAKFEKKLAELKGTLQDVKEEIKEEKKEIAEQKKEIKVAVKQVQSAQKEVRQKAIKKVAEKKVERKEVEVKKTKRKEKLKAVMSELDELIEKSKKLRAKYGSDYKGTGKPSSLERDAKRQAKPFGYRFKGKHDYRVPTEMQIRRGLKRGTIDYEARPNRADVNPDARKVKLAKGGIMDDGNFHEGQTVIIVGNNGSMVDKSVSRVIDEYNNKELVIEKIEPNKPFNNATASLKSTGEKVPFTLVLNPKYIKHGEIMKRGGKVGFSDEDKSRFAKPAGYRWKEEAFEKGIVSRADLGKSPSRKMREKYPDLIYFEDRLNKSDKKPTRTSAPSFKKGGKVVGKSAEDKARFAKPAGWRWKEEALKKGIIERKQLGMSPSKKMREKYPDLVYFEDRLNKADKKPTRTSADSI